jgi:nitrate reductase NapE component
MSYYNNGSDHLDGLFEKIRREGLTPEQRKREDHKFKCREYFYIMVFIVMGTIALVPWLVGAYIIIRWLWQIIVH